MRGFLSLGIQWPWVGRSLQGQQGPRCQGVRTQNTKDVVYTGSGAECSPLLGGQARAGHPRSELHRGELVPEATWARAASSTCTSCPYRILQSRTTRPLQAGKRAPGRGHEGRCALKSTSPRALERGGGWGHAPAQKEASKRKLRLPIEKTFETPGNAVTGHVLGADFETGV